MRYPNIFEIIFKIFFPAEEGWIYEVKWLICHLSCLTWRSASKIGWVKRKKMPHIIVRHFPNVHENKHNSNNIRSDEIYNIFDQ